MRRLPETDLANTAALPLGERQSALWRINLKNPTVNYRPTRRREPDIFNGRAELFGQAQEADLETIKRLIRKDPFTRNAATERANIEVSECLHDFAIKSRIRARRYYISPFVLPAAAGIKLTYWSPLILIKDERLHVVFIDPRRENGLTPEGRHFVFSMMHHRARAVYLDLKDAEIMICQCPMADDAQRYLKVHTASELDIALFSYDELEKRVRETYTIWQDVLAQRAAEQRRKADRDRGDFNLSA
jgi:hypothetical protein